MVFEVSYCVCTASITFLSHGLSSEYILEDIITTISIQGKHLLKTFPPKGEGLYPTPCKLIQSVTAWQNNEKYAL